MFRAVAPRGLTLRPLAQGFTAAPRSAHSITQFHTKATFHNATKFEAKVLSLTAYQQKTALVRSYATDAALTGTYRSAAKEEQYRNHPIESRPDLVSATSSTHPAFSGEIGTEEKEEETDMMAGVKHDLAVIKDTFKLDAIPKEAIRIGLAGVIPYLVTSTATVVCAFEMNSAVHSGSGFLMDAPTAEALLHILEPLQIGYGAVILSCLGTIHWGLEWAGYGGSQGYKRYMIGVVTPAVAWPTTFMPVEYALITQFLAFNTLYAVDSATVTRGWTPQWYGTYRFLLTFVVGTSIVISLIGRGQIQDQVGTAPTAAKRVNALRQLGHAAEKKVDQETGEDDE